MYYPFFEKFVKNIVALSIEFIEDSSYEKVAQNHWLFGLIKQFCTSLTHLIIKSPEGKEIDMILVDGLAPKLTSLTLHYMTCMNIRQWTEHCHPQLKILRCDGEFGGEDLIRLVQNSPQLSHLRLTDLKDTNDIIELLKGQLNRFKSLELREESEETHVDEYNSTDVTVDGLEALTISVCGITVVDILRAIASECKRIKRLNIFMEDYSYSVDSHVATPDEIVNALSLVEHVESLTMNGFDLEFVLIQNLMQHLPELLSLHLNNNRNDDLTPNDVLHLFEAFPKLKVLTFESRSHRDGQLLLPFDMNFHRQFVNIVRDRSILCKFHLCTDGAKMLFTNEKCIKNAELRHWIGYEADRSRSQTKFSSLDETCIGKIARYLNQEDVRALYETCALTKKALANHIGAQQFEISIEKDFLGAKNLINRFGEHIRKLVVNMESANPAKAMEIWSRIGNTCGKKLVELTVRKGHVEPLIQWHLSFPNLNILRLQQMESKGPYVLPLMDCSKLKLLDLILYKIEGKVQKFQPGIPLGSLKALRFIGSASSIVKVLNWFNDEICDQVKVLSLISSEFNAGLLNAVIRFRNLIGLDLNKSDIGETDTRYLFKRCQKLEKLSLNVGYKMNRDTFDNIKEYCKHLKELRLYGYIDSKEATELFPNVKINIIKP